MKHWALRQPPSNKQNRRVKWAKNEIFPLNYFPKVGTLPNRLEGSRKQSRFRQSLFVVAVAVVVASFDPLFIVLKSRNRPRHHHRSISEVVSRTSYTDRSRSGRRKFCASVIFSTFSSSKVRLFPAAWLVFKPKKAQAQLPTAHRLCRAVPELVRLDCSSAWRISRRRPEQTER